MSAQDYVDYPYIDLKEAFKVFDQDEDGLINKKELKQLVSALGHTLKHFELKTMWKEADPENVGAINFEQFCGVMASRILFEITEEELIDAFRVFDNEDTGYILTKDLKHVLLNFGDKLSEKEASDLLKDADFAWTGKVNYHEFARTLLRK